MRKCKRFLSHVLALIMILGVLPSSVSFADLYMPPIHHMKLVEIDAGGIIRENALQFMQPFTIGDDSAFLSAGFIEIQLNPLTLSDIVQLNFQLSNIGGSGKVRLLVGNVTNYAAYKNAELILETSSEVTPTSYTLNIQGEAYNKLIANGGKFYITTTDFCDMNIFITSILSGVPIQDQAAPVALVGAAPTSAATNDGKITGTSWAMEYIAKVGGGATAPSNWTPAPPAPNTEITGLSPGTYQVRYAARPGYNVSSGVDVTVPAYVILSSDNTVISKVGSSGPYYLIQENAIASGRYQLTNYVAISTFLDNVVLPAKATHKVVEKFQTVNDAATFNSALAKPINLPLAAGDKLAVKAENGDVRVYAINLLSNDVTIKTQAQHYTVFTNRTSSDQMSTNQISSNLTAITGATTVESFISNLDMPLAANYRVTTKNIATLDHRKIAEEVMIGTGPDYKTAQSTLANGDFVYVLSESRGTYNRYSIVVIDTPQAPPEGLVGMAPTSSTSNDGKITGVSELMAYRAKSGGTATEPSDWTAAPKAPITELTGLVAGVYQVRFAARDGYIVSQSVDVTVPVYVAPSNDNKVLALDNGVVVDANSDIISSGFFKISNARLVSTLVSKLIQPAKSTLKVVNKMAQITDAASFDNVQANTGQLELGDRLVVKAENGEVRIHLIDVLNAACQVIPKGQHYRVNGADISAWNTPITSATTVESLIANLEIPVGATYKVTTSDVQAQTLAAIKDVVVNGSGANYKTDQSALSSGDYLYVLSECQEWCARYNIAVTNQDQNAPGGFVSIAPLSAVNNDGKITGVSELMEYKVKAGGAAANPTDWTAAPKAPITEITGLAAGIYQLRFAARVGYNASESVDVTVPEYVAPLSEDATVTAKVAGDYNINTGANAIAPGLAKITTATTVEGLLSKLAKHSGAQWKVLDSTQALNDRSTAIPDFDKAKGLANSALLSDGLRLAVKSESNRVIVVYIIELVNDSQAKPTGLAGVAPTSAANSNGKLTGTTAAMEYRNMSAPRAFTKATDKEVLGLVPGTYQVRFAVKPGYNPSVTTEVIIQAYVAPPREEEPEQEPNNSGENTGNNTAAGTGNGAGNGNGTGNGAGSGDITIKEPVTPLGSLTFSDLRSVEWANKAIGALNARGILLGKTPTQFDPNGPITRAEFAAITARLLKLGVKPVAKPQQQILTFADINPKQWFAADVLQAAAAGYMAGGNGRFNPSAFTTRQEISTLIGRMLIANTDKISKTATIAPTDIGTYTDAAQIANWATEGAALCHKYGIVTGSNGKFEPKARVTRAEAAVMLYRLIELLGL